MPSNSSCDRSGEVLIGHPAVEAWSRLRPARVEPDSIVVLKQEEPKSSVYRLVGVGPGGTAVIAKRSKAAPARIERTIYQELLPQLPVSSLFCHGLVEDADGEHCWLFVEDAGGEMYSPRVAAHRAVAARWLASVHTQAVRLAGTTSLPDRGIAYYLKHLESATEVIRNLSNPALTQKDLRVLADIVSQYENLASHWNLLEKLCGTMPPTLVHCDFHEKNVRIRSGPDGLEVLPFDWEEAGYGIPAADLAQRPSGGFPSPDLETYWSAVRNSWLHLSESEFHWLAEVGTILRCLAAVGWAAPDLTDGAVGKPMARLEVYHAEIARAVRAAGLDE